MSRSIEVVLGSFTSIDAVFESTAANGLDGKVYDTLGVKLATAVVVTQSTADPKNVVLSNLPSVEGVDYAITYRFNGIGFTVEYPESTRGIRREVKVIPSRVSGESIASFSIALSNNGFANPAVLVLNQNSGDDYILSGFPIDPDNYLLKYTVPGYSIGIPWKIDAVVSLPGVEVCDSLVAVFDSIMPIVAQMNRDCETAEFVIPETRISTTTIGGAVDLQVDGGFAIGAGAVRAVNSDGDGLSGDVMEASIVTIAGDSYSVGSRSRASGTELVVNISGGTVSTLVGGESVSFSVNTLQVADVVPLSVDSYYAIHSEGVVTFGFQYARVRLAVVPKVGWVCKKGDESGQVIFVDILATVVVVWVGKVGTRQ